MDASNLYRGVCTKGEKQTAYCLKKDCGDADVPMDNKEVQRDPKLKYHFNGHGRIDPTYFDPFKVERATNVAINIDEIIKEVESMKEQIGTEYDGVSDIQVLTHSVQKHSKMDDSKIRLGLKLSRSLILGDTFHAVFTGSSNTAGHDNMFMSSYPMQLQSILRPLWKRIGYKGAAFRVSDRGVGGAIGSDQLTWCIPQISGGNAEKIDVIFWESIMNDAGSDNSRRHTLENHIRNVLTMSGGTFNGNVPQRALWHAVIAGANGDQPNSFTKSRAIYDGYKDLIEEYSKFGAGIIEFNPSLGMNPMKTRQPEIWKDEKFYVTWHPGPSGHRLYAEIIAYYYLDATLSVLRDIQKTVKDLEAKLNLTIARPVLEMLDLLQDAPYQAGLPPAEHSKKCKPVCTDTLSSYCMLGYNPKDEIYDISNYVIAANKWRYQRVAGNEQPITAMDGGQASIDTKYGYKGNKDSGQLILSIKILPNSNKLLMVEKPYADWGGLNDVLKSMASWFTVEIVDVIDIVIENENDQKKIDEIKKNQIGKKLKCETKDRSLWMRDVIEFGCLIKFEYAGKYHVALTVDTKEDIPICVVVTM